VVREPVDERDGARRIGKDGVPVLEDEIGCHHNGALFVAAADDLKQQGGGVRVVGQVADLID